MAGRISPAFIQELLTRTDIVELINEKVPLQKKGTNNYVANCPFHEEKTPSFTVSSQKQIYHCFGCKASGNAISFLMEYSKMGFVEAVEAVADRIGMQVQYESGTPKHVSQKYKQLLALMDEVAEFYVQQLRKAPHAQKYLVRRGLEQKTLESFNIGYAPPGFDQLQTLFGKRYNKNLLEEAGLITSKEGRSYARFRDRIVFPIRNKRGQTIAFGGRLLADQDQQPKYLNSPETQLFEKRNVVYGIYELCQVRKLDEILLVEGYMDVVALAQHGFNNASAVLGTAVTQKHLQQLFALSKKLVVCFDGDEAGKKASDDCMLKVLSTFKDGDSVHFVNLPENQDPDSFVKEQGANGLRTILKESLPLSSYLFAYLQNQLDLNTPEGRASFCNRARPVLATVQASAFRDLLFKDMAQRAGLSIEHLQTPEPPAPKPKTFATPPRKHYSIFRTSVARIIGKPVLVYLDDIPSIEAIRSLPVQETQDQKLAELLIDLIEKIRKENIRNTAALIEAYHDHVYAKAIAFMAQGETPPDEDAEFIQSMENLSLAIDRHKEEQLIEKARTTDLLQDEKEELLTLQKKKRKRGKNRVSSP